MNAMKYRIRHSRVLLVLVASLNAHLVQGTQKGLDTETTTIVVP